MISLENIINELEILIPNPKCELIYTNNYELLCSVMLSAQTTDKAVNEVTKILFNKYPDFKSLALASYDDLTSIIKPIGLMHVKAKNLILISKMIITKFNSEVPNNKKDLMSLPGIGNKTANVILALGFGIPALPVDTHVSRVSKRLGLVLKEDNVLVIEDKLMKQLDSSKWIKAHHLLLLFGRYYCLAKNPQCNGCPFKDKCHK